MDSELFLFSSTKIINLPKKVLFNKGQFSIVIDELKIKEEGNFNVVVKNKRINA